MLAQSPPQDKQLVLMPATDFEAGRWVQVSLPIEYHKAMNTALAWKSSGYTTMVSQKPDGWRVYVSVVIVERN